MKNHIHPLERLTLAAILLAANVGLLWGEVRSDWIYFPQGRGGWTFLTHPFVHVSGYHLLLDAGAFVFLYHSLSGLRLVQRWGALLACGVGSFWAAVWLTPDLGQTGFCGLSGIGHGLMAVVGLLALKDAGADPLERRIMGLMLIGLLAKVVYEVFSGQVVFASSHFGDVGKPVTACHLGGVLGGVLFCHFVAKVRKPAGHLLVYRLE